MKSKIASLVAGFTFVSAVSCENPDPVKETVYLHKGEVCGYLDEFNSIDDTFFFINRSTTGETGVLYRIEFKGDFDKVKVDKAMDEYNLSGKIPEINDIICE